MNEPTLEQVRAESAADSLRAAMTGAGVADVNTGGGDTAPEGGAGSDTVPLTPAAPAGSRAITSRDPDTGKFTAVATDRDTPVAISTQQKLDANAALDPVEPPTNWKLDEQERFRKMSPDDQRFLMARLSASTAVPEPLRGVDQIVNQRASAWARLGQTPAAAINQLLTISDFASERPRDFINWFMRERGLTESPRTNGAAPAKAPGSALDELDPTDPIHKDPVFVALKNEINVLKGTIGELSGGLRQRADAETNQVRQAAGQELQNFQNEKDATGNPKHPYFEEVRDLMAAFIDPRLGAGAARTLGDAYIMACRAHPEVHQKVAAADKAAADRQRQKDEREKAAKAKTAGASVTGGAGGASPPAQTGDLRSDLRAEFKARGMFGVSPTI